MACAEDTSKSSPTASLSPFSVTHRSAPRQIPTHSGREGIVIGGVSAGAAAHLRSALRSNGVERDDIRDPVWAAGQVGPAHPPAPHKGWALAGVARRAAEVYHRTKDLEYDGSPLPGAFQLVLCDLGTPKAGAAHSYGRIRAGLIAAGMPATKIRFAHEATTTRAREALFAGCRDGRIAVLVGSTAKVGIRVNVQDRLNSIHRVDPPWTPAAWDVASQV